MKWGVVGSQEAWMICRETELLTAVAQGRRKTTAVNYDRNVRSLVGHNRTRTGKIGCKYENKNHNNAPGIFPCCGVAVSRVWRASEEVMR